MEPLSELQYRQESVNIERFEGRIVSVPVEYHEWPGWEEGGESRKVVLARVAVGKRGNIMPCTFLSIFEDQQADWVLESGVDTPVSIDGYAYYAPPPEAGRRSGVNLLRTTDVTRYQPKLSHHKK